MLLCFAKLSLALAPVLLTVEFARFLLYQKGSFYLWQQQESLVARATSLINPVTKMLKAWAWTLPLASPGFR